MDARPWFFFAERYVGQNGNKKPIFNRILLKVSGEALIGEREYGIDPRVVRQIAEEIKEIHELGVQIGVVLGGGNIFRGLSAVEQGMDRASADYMGMLATVLNSLAVQDALEKVNVVTRVQTAIKMEQIAEPFIRRRAIRHLEKGRVVILAAGTGNPFFTTDTAASLRAAEIEADVILKATRVDGVFSADPEIDRNAFKFEEISHLDVVKKELNVMDTTAITLSRDNKLPIIVYNMKVPGNLKRLILGESVGTRIQ